MKTSPACSKIGHERLDPRRVLLIALGSLCVGLGTVGIFVPGLPTTVFLLAASWCYAQSSPRLRRKLHANERLGVYLRQAGERSLPVRARVIALLGIWGGISLAIVGGGVTAIWLRVVLVIAGLVGSAFVLSMRRKPGPVEPAAERPAVATHSGSSSCLIASSSIPTTSPIAPTSAGS